MIMLHLTNTAMTAVCVHKDKEVSLTKLRLKNEIKKWTVISERLLIMKKQFYQSQNTWIG